MSRFRRAFNYAFDFEEMNKQLFYGQYKRISSYFEGTELRPGLPEGEELANSRNRARQGAGGGLHEALHQPGRRQCRSVRNNLREATRLLKEAGFDVRDRKLVDRAGKQVTVEFLVADPSSERIMLFYKPALERLGITVNVRTVETRSTRTALRNFDFDMTTASGGSRCRPATSSANIGARKPPTSQARATPSASRTRRSMR